MGDIILYTTHCPKCKVLTLKLNQKGVQFTECEDTAVMREKGLQSVPALQVGDEILDFTHAVAWINGRPVS